MLQTNEQLITLIKSDKVECMRSLSKSSYLVLWQDEDEWWQVSLFDPNGDESALLEQISDYNKALMVFQQTFDNLWGT